MAPLHDPAAEIFARLLPGFRAKQTIASCAALLTFPEFQAATFRIDYLVHLALLHCAGKRKATDADIARWMNRDLASSRAWELEDPPEDAFIASIATREGSFRIFQGVVANNDYYLQRLLAAAEPLAPQAPALAQCIESVKALLRLSEGLCERLGLDRVSYASSAPRRLLSIVPSTGVRERAAQLSFSWSELAALGISRELLEPFVFGETDLQALRQASDTGASSLRFRPILAYDKELLLALPNAVATAARHALASTAGELGLIAMLNERLAAIQAAEALAALSAIGPVEEHPLDGEDQPPLASFQLDFERGHRIHLVVVPDDILAAAKGGDFADAVFSDREKAAIQARLSRAQAQIEAAPGFERATAMYLFGGIGRRVLLHAPPDRPGWQSLGLEVPDLVKCLCTRPVEFRRFMKYLDQTRWARARGVDFANPYGAFGGYCHWVVAGFKVVPTEFPLRPGASLPMVGEFLALVRTAWRGLVDAHMAELEEGSYVDVVRFGQDARLPRYEHLPLYVSPSAAGIGVHAGVVESARGRRWLMSSRSAAGGPTVAPADNIWLNFLPFFAELVLELDEREVLAPGTLQVYIDLTAVRDLAAVGTFADAGTAFGAQVIATDGGSARVIVPADFFHGFVTADNHADKAFLLKLGEALLAASGAVPAAGARDALEAACDRVLPPGGGRLLQVFSGQDPVDIVLHGKGEAPVLVDRADMQFVRIGIGLDQGRGAQRVLNGAKECRAFLNGVVDATVGQVKDMLKRLRRDAVIEMGLRSLEAIFADKLQWRNTAHSHLNLFGQGEAVKAAYDRQMEHVEASLATRVLLEIAICECPPDGLAVARSEFERLLALVTLMIEVAYDSAAIHGGLARPELVIFPNGEYRADRKTTASIMMPFASNDFTQQYQDAAKQYETYLMPNRGERTLPQYPEDFSSAFASEFGVAPLDFIRCTAELAQIGVEAGGAVVRSTAGAIRARLAGRGIVDAAAAQRFLESVCLVSRPDWSSPPAPYNQRDTWPWLFRRRLSLMVRPVLADGLGDNDSVYYGLAQLAQSYYQLLTRCEMGRLPPEFFLSRAMQAYVGSAANRYGPAFEDEVAELLQDQGWRVRARVEMTELGATAALGDVDVLAWKPDGRVLAIECKWLKSARSVTEVAEMLKKFAGDKKEKDKLAKHLDRIEWLKQDRNTRELRRVTELGRDSPLSVHGLLVTDKDVPMMYVEDLPIPSKDVVPKRRLLEVAAGLI